MMQLITYLTFDGSGEDALNFYRDIFDAQIKTITRYQDAPFDVPPEYKNRIMYAELELGEIQLLISDIAPERYDLHTGNQIALMLNSNDKSKMSKVFDALATDGNVIEALEDTFWGTTFGMVIDQFGIPWKISISAPSPNNEM